MTSHHVIYIKHCGRSNSSKAAGPNNIPRWAFRAAQQAASQLSTFSSATALFPLLSKQPPSLPFPPTFRNDYKSLTLTPIIMKCVERVLLAQIQNSMTWTPCSMLTDPTGLPQTYCCSTTICSLSLGG